MKIAIRADASREIGHGHVMRCLALAEALGEHGAEVVFLCRDLPGDAREAISARGFEVRPVAPSSESGESDAGSCLQALASGTAPDWLVVDHYRLDADWGHVMRRCGARLMAIDDLADRSLDCDLLLDQNWHEAPAARYAGRIPAVADTLFGPGYALLRAEFAAARASRVERDGQVRRLLLCFGGADSPNATGAALGALNTLPDLMLDVVVGAGCPHVAALQAQCAALPAARLSVGAQDIAARMAAADLFVGAGGTMSWERACLGLPGITLPIADNQRVLCVRIDAAGEGIDLGPPTPAALQRLPRVVTALAAEPAWLRAMSRALSARCDGLGAARVAARLLAD